MALVTWRAPDPAVLEDQWVGIGQYPTPSTVVEAFANDLLAFITQGAAGLLRKRSILLADMFSGDGRLGIAVREALRRKTRASIYTSFLECDPSQANRINGKRYPGTLVVANALSVHPSKALDIVVANPPYLALSVHSATELGLKWKEVLDAGRNLYGVSLRRAIEVCAPGRVVALIAPFSWVRGHYSQGLRRFIGHHCSHVAITAHRDRLLFEDAQQDIGFQFFIKRRAGERGRCDVTFRYVGDEPAVTYLPYLRKQSKLEDHLRVRVGPFVWNRNKRITRAKEKRGTVPIVYGGNIGPDGSLRPVVLKYRKRQFAKICGLPEEWICRGPALVIRRTLRGCPGAWIIDSTILAATYRFVAENHVIVITGNGIDRTLRTLKPRLLKALQRHARFLGTPNLSANKVRNVLRRTSALRSGL